MVRFRACSASAAANDLKRKRGRERERETKTKTEDDEAKPIIAAPAPPPFNGSGRRVNFILDNAAIKKILVKKKWKVPCSLDDAEVILRQNKDVNEYRCDIVHEFKELLMVIPHGLHRVFPHRLIYCQHSHGAMKRRKRRSLLQRCLQEKLTPCSEEKLEPKQEDAVGEGEDKKKDIGESRKYETNNTGNSVDILPGIPPEPCSNTHPKPGVIFVLEKASLVPAYVGRTYEILNPDKHSDFLRKKNMNPYDYRPDIIHEILVDILGSRLNMAGRIQAVYIKTDLGHLIKVKPNVRVPPTLAKFCAMMSQLLQKFSIKSTGEGEKLMQLIQNPLIKYLPVNSRKIGLSLSSPKAVRLRDYVSSVDSDCTPVFVIGAMAHGKIDSDYADDLISVSALPLSAGVCVRRICFELERQWGIL